MEVLTRMTLQCEMQCKTAEKEENEGKELQDVERV